jgi:hypothetical protein
MAKLVPEKKTRRFLSRRTNIPSGNHCLSIGESKVQQTGLLFTDFFAPFINVGDGVCHGLAEDGVAEAAGFLVGGVTSQVSEFVQEDCEGPF